MISEKEHTELLLLYQHAMDDIDRTKREQWFQFYAILAVQVGVAGVTAIRFAPSGAAKSTDAISAILDGLLVLGLLVIVLYQLRLVQMRSLVHRYRALLEPRTRTILETDETPPLLRIGILLVMISVMCLVWYGLTIVMSS
ncbi:MAG TPA: hypothetical protein VIU63_10945 [Nitrospira sp.]